MVKRKWRIFLLYGFLLYGSWCSLGFGASLPSPLQGVGISTQVSKDNQTGIFSYQYQVANPTTNSGQIWHIDIEISRSPSEAVLSREGLINGPRYLRHSSEDALQRVSMVPVGIAGPENWLSGLGFDDKTPPRGLASWGSTDDPFFIVPGSTLQGFQITSHGLPGIRDIEVQPWVDPDLLPENLITWEEVNNFYQQFLFRTKTIGPKAPPQAFVPIEFLNYLITLLHNSRQLGWIKVDGVHQSLLAKLINAKRKLEAGEVAEAKNILNAFLNEVQATSCEEVSCRGNKPQTSEAYALLFFNGRFLWERLP